MPPPSNKRDDDISPLPTFAKKPVPAKVNDVENSFLTGAPMPKHRKSAPSKKHGHGRDGHHVESAPKRRHVAPSEREEDEDDDVESRGASEASYTEESDASGSDADDQPAEEHVDKPSPKAKTRQSRPPARVANEFELVPGFIYHLCLNNKNQLSVPYKIPVAPPGTMTCGTHASHVRIGKGEAGLYVKYTDDKGITRTAYGRVQCKERSAFYVGKA